MTCPLAVEHATVRFGSTTALDDATLAVPGGSVTAVVGPSGSGKSTLLRVIAGLQRLDGGRVVVAGRDLDGVAPHRRGVGLMFQDHALFPHRDVAGNVGFGLRMQRMPPEGIRSRVAELLEMVGLSGFGDRAVQTLSGGEQQRVALARALAPGPSVLLLDEPLGALDRSLRERLALELRALFADLGITVVAVTHDHREAFVLGDEVAVMDEGTVLQVGAPAALWDRPGSARVAQVLGFANVLDVTVAGGVAATPWGDLPVTGAPDGPAVVMIRPAGVRIGAPTGPDRARVAASTFAGDHTEIRLERPGTPALDAVVPSPTAPSVGTSVSVSVDPAAVVLLGP